MSELPATPKQIAYLSYMGVSEADALTRKEASDRIDTLMDTPSQEHWNWLFERQGAWMTDRFILHHDLYASEFQRYLDEQLPDSLHAYVRGRVTGAPETLTKSKIKKVIHAITADDREWWRSTQKNEVFFERLAQMYPGCCEGGPRTRSPQSGPKIQQQRFSPLDYQTLGSLFRHLAEFCEPWEITFSDGKISGCPQELLDSLGHDWLTIQISEYLGDADGSHFTVTKKTLLGSQSRTFHATWHSDRHGWADSGPGAKAVHYFVPRRWLVDPPQTSERLLVSLCKKAWIGNDSPFYPVDPRRTLCRVCSSHHENWNSQES